MLKTKNELFIAGLFIAIVAMEVWMLGFESRMSLNCSSAFFSAAACYDYGQGFNIDPDQIKEFVHLPDEQRNAYSFSDSANTVRYNHNPIGYAYFIMLARAVFFFAGDIVAISLLQVAVHVLICLYIFSKLNGTLKRAAFLLFYSTNPIILLTCLTCFYYFWQVFASLSILILLLNRQAIERLGRNKRILLISLISAVNGLVLTTRPTVVLAVIFFWILCVCYKYWIEAVCGILCAVAVFFLLFYPTAKHPWHTACVGIAAYSNPYDLKFSDSQGYRIYEQITGKKLDDSITRGYIGNYYDDDVAKDYARIMKQYYMDFLKSHPLTALRNTSLNVLQGYSIGYTNGLPMWAYYINAAIGIITILMLLYTRQYVLFLAIGLISGTFTLFYPPHPSYLFGAYIMLVIGWLNGIEEITRRKPTSFLPR